MNNGVTAHNTVAALEQFLGTIDNAEEAIILLDAKGFYWESGENTGMRETSEGWEFIALQLVRACTPVQTDQVRIVIRRQGGLHELERKVFEKLDNACV